ncbi:MAG: LysR substrate-binding domain-containing protein [Oleiphilaceae bacterium]|nr:LysR substrate-binding domain-containing protein [Oleiphilaceae bacterium]
MLSLKQITYALAVEKTLHFKKAADACAISQSALSTALNELEKQLGFQVFERDNKKVLVTPLGQQFLDKARQVKLQVDELHQLSRAQQAPLSYPMTLGVIPTIGPYLLPRVLPDLRKAYPEFRLTLVEEESATLVDLVRQGDIDSAIIALPYAHDGLLAFEFWEEDFYWVSHAEDPAVQQGAIASEAIDPGTLMLLKDGHCLKDHALAACKLSRSEMSRAFTATSLMTLTQMVAGKMGSTFVPHMALASLVDNNEELRAIPLKESGPHRTLAFLTRPNYTGLDSIELLRKQFRESLFASVV